MKVEIEINDIRSMLDAMLEARYVLGGDTVLRARANAWDFFERHGWDSLMFVIEDLYPWVTHWRPDELVRIFTEETELARMESYWR